MSATLASKISEGSLRELRERPIRVSLVVPVYNEEETVDLFVDRVNSVFLRTTEIRVEIIFVNDGSTDETLSRLIARQQRDDSISIVDLSRNFGKEAALTAGIYAATGDAVVPIDVDLQDPAGAHCGNDRSLAGRI